MTKKISDSNKLGQQIRAMENGTEFSYSTIAGEFDCVKVSDNYIASTNIDNDLIIFDVYENCLSIGNSNPTNYNAIKRMAKGLKINN